MEEQIDFHFNQACVHFKVNVGIIYYLVYFPPPEGITLLENKRVKFFVVKDNKMSIAQW